MYRQRTIFQIPFKFNKKASCYSYSYVKKYSSLKNHNIFDQKVKYLNSSLTKDEKIDKNKLNELIKQIEKTKSCDSNIALEAIELCGIQSIDLFPHKRQEILNNLFNKLLRETNLKYEISHYDLYLTTTILNQGSFLPIEFDRQILHEKLTPNLGVCSSFMTQLCNLSQTRLAFLYLKKILQSQNFEINLEKIQNDCFIKTENFFDNFCDDIKQLTVDQDLTQLINPLIYHLYQINEPNKSLKLVDLMHDINLKPNYLTFSCLIKGNLTIEEYDEAKKLFEKNLNSLKFENYLDLYFTLSKNHDSNVKKDFESLLIKNISEHFKEENLIHAVDLIYKLGKAKKFDEALLILQACDRSKEIKLGDYFFKTLVEYENRTKQQISYSNLHGNKIENLKSLLYYTLKKQNTENSLKILNELKDNGEQAKVFYFYPIIAKEVSALSNALLNNEKNIKNFVNYKRIDSILKNIRFNHNILLTNDDLYNILEIIKANDRLNLIKYKDISHLFDQNGLFKTTHLFNSCANKILNNRLKKIKKNLFVTNYNLTIDDVHSDFADLFDLIMSLNVTLIDKNVMSNLEFYLRQLYKANLIFKNANRIGDNIIVKTLSLINERIGFEQSEILKVIKQDFKDYGLKFASENQIDATSIDQILDFRFKKSFESVRKDRKFRKNLEYLDTKEDIKTLISSIAELESKNKNFYPSIRRLIIKLCNSEQISQPIELIKKYTQLLPENELTPIVCQDLMNFYARQTFDYETSKYYFYKLKKVIVNKDIFQVDAKKLIEFIETMFNSKNFSLSDVKETFKFFKFSEANDDSRVLKTLIEFAFGQFNSKLTPNEYKDLIESIFDNNFASRNVIILNFVMLKFISWNQLDNALEYLKFNFSNHKISVCEILLLKEYLEKYKDKPIAGTKLEELLLFFSKFYQQDLVFNFLFYANCMCGDYKTANSIYEKNLAKKIDLNVLKRLVNQLDLKLKNSPYSKSLLNILKFKHFNQNTADIKEFHDIIKNVI